MGATGRIGNKIRSYAYTQQEDIIRDWNSFARVDIKRAATDALEDALKNQHPLSGPQAEILQR